MDDSTLLYIGMFCFAMIGLGMGLTVYEFKKISLPPQNVNPPDQKAKTGLVNRTRHLAELR